MSFYLQVISIYSYNDLNTCSTIYVNSFNRIYFKYTFLEGGVWDYEIVVFYLLLFKYYYYVHGPRYIKFTTYQFILICIVCQWVGITRTDAKPINCPLA